MLLAACIGFNVVNLQIPPLWQRPEDILLLGRHFLDNLSRFYEEPQKILSPETERILLRYRWPGNVREMANAMERAYILSKKRIIEPAALPPEILLGEFAKSKSPLPTLEEANERLVNEALRITKGRKIAAAKILGINPKTLESRMKKLAIVKES